VVSIRRWRVWERNSSGSGETLGGLDDEADERRKEGTRTQNDSVNGGIVFCDYDH
jgi:hypothetical protein